MFQKTPVSKSSLANRKPILGVGINDAEYKVHYTDSTGKGWKCPYYATWMNILTRCFSPASLKERSTYSATTLEESWKYFSNFRDWMEQQNWEGKCLDKDLISWGNKHYGPDTCLFISKELNNLLCLHGNARGDLPIGVTRNITNGLVRYRARCKWYGKSQQLGNFQTVEEAAAAYKTSKLKYIAELAEKETDPRTKQALLNLW